MAQFWTRIEGQAGPATRLGSKNSGASAIAAGWGGAVRVDVWHNATTGKDEFEVSQIPHHGSGCSAIIARGVLGEPVEGSDNG